METSVNNKCKAFTSLEQSKKLAEILPLESADMVIWGRDLDFVAATDAQKFMSGLEDRKMKYLPCWSLVALLGVLPYGYSSILTKCFNGKDYYCKIDGKPFESIADNPIDACYEIILKLNELNLL